MPTCGMCWTGSARTHIAGSMSCCPIVGTRWGSRRGRRDRRRDRERRGRGRRVKPELRGLRVPAAGRGMGDPACAHRTPHTGRAKSMPCSPPDAYGAGGAGGSVGAGGDRAGAGGDPVGGGGEWGRRSDRPDGAVATSHRAGDLLRGVTKGGKKPGATHLVSTPASDQPGASLPASRPRVGGSAGAAPSRIPARHSVELYLETIRERPFGPRKS